MMNARVTIGTSKYQASNGSLAGSSMSVVTFSVSADSWFFVREC